MAGTFRFGDVFYSVPVLFSQLRPGDVIVFRHPRSDACIQQTVHRVVKCTAMGLITQGDACALPDATVVVASQLLGRVVRVQRGNKSYPVWNGWAGRLWARYVQIRRRLLGLGHAPYRWLHESGLVRRLWRPPVSCVTIATAQAPLVKYLHRGKTIAVWRPSTQAFWCRKPYDLVLDAPMPTTNGSRIYE